MISCAIISVSQSFPYINTHTHTHRIAPASPGVQFRLFPVPLVQSAGQLSSGEEGEVGALGEVVCVEYQLYLGIDACQGQMSEQDVHG